MSQETFAILLGLLVGPIAAIPTIVLIAAVITEREKRRYYQPYRPPVTIIHQPPIEVLDASRVYLLEG